MSEVEVYLLKIDCILIKEYNSQEKNSDIKYISLQGFLRSFDKEPSL